MARLGVLLFLVVVLMGDVASLWSSGVEWGTATTPRANAYWQPGTAVPSGVPFPDIAIGGELLTTSAVSASWSLGIRDYLSDLSPNTASLSFVGQVSGSPGDDVVISTELGAAWSGRLDTLTVTRDAAGDYWTTATATDKLGALGIAELDGWDYTAEFPLGAHLKQLTRNLTRDVGAKIEIDDLSTLGFPTFDEGPASFSGSVLDLINRAARSTNAMVALTRGGGFSAYLRAPETPSSVLTLTGVNAPASWSSVKSLDTHINRMRMWYFGASPATVASNATAIELYGERTYEGVDFQVPDATQTIDWGTYINTVSTIRAVAEGEMVVTDYTQDDLILLDPLQWVTESGTAWMVLSVQHEVRVGGEWRVAITVDNLLDVL